MPASRKASAPKRDLAADIDRISAQIEALMKLRETLDARFSAVSEKIGEIRSMVLTQEKDSSELKKRVEKAVSMVEETHPESLYTEFKKKEAEISVLKDRIASTEELLKTLMADLKDLRRTVSEFRGIEGLINLSKDIRADLKSLQKTKAEMEKYADKVVNIFVEVQRRFKELAKLVVRVDSQGESLKSIGKGLSSLEIRMNDMVTKIDLEKTSVEIEKTKKWIEEIRQRMTAMEAETKSFRKMLEDLSKGASGESVAKYFTNLQGLESRINELERRMRAAEQRGETQVLRAKMEEPEQKLTAEKEEQLKIKKPEREKEELW
ncbi:MAG: hypothetical protein QXG10_05320 [Candidatus Hadarchaeales archaeon]